MDATGSVNFSPQTFYGKARCKKVYEEKSSKRPRCGSSVVRWPRLLDPSAVWKIFEKQKDALEYLKLKRNRLMAFAFEEQINRRMFLVANPSILWHFYSKRCERDRSMYEIILENSACKLYFDLEFWKENNPEHDGSRMTNTFIKIIALFLKKKWNIIIDRSSVLELDSSTDVKYSRHLIFQLPKVVFENNYQVGYFVKDICSTIKAHIASCHEHHKSVLNSVNDIENSCLCELMVYDRKGENKLFCDEGVYTKNRQFRLYLSTKLNKNTPLVVSKENVYHPKVNDHKVYEQQLFLDSLITFISDDNVKVLKYEQVEIKGSSSISGHVGKKLLQASGAFSPYPELDNFISKLVYPGHIWRNVYFSCASTIVYDIIGYRYCGNIGRHHCRNNIKYVVNLEKFMYYQKCYDPDCSDYRSPEQRLPFELLLYLEDENLNQLEDVKSFDSTSGYFGICEADLLEAMEAVAHMKQIYEEESNEVPDYGVSDDELSASLCTLGDSVKCSSEN